MCIAEMQLCAGKLASPSSGIGSNKDDSAADSAIEFCNTPEGYLEMGKQLGIAFAALLGS